MDNLGTTENNRNYQSILAFLSHLVHNNQLITTLEMHLKCQNAMQTHFQDYNRFKKQLNRMIKEVNSAGLRKKIRCCQMEQITRETQLRKEIVADILAYY